MGVASEREREVDYIVGSGEIRDFDIEFYNPTGLDEKEIARHVYSYLGEKLMMPRSERLWIGRKGELDPEYLQIMNRAVEHARLVGDERAVSRYENELEGMSNLVDLVIKVDEKGETLPAALIASDPGDFYVDLDGRKKSNTFVMMLDEEQESGWRYRVLALPTKYIGLDRHWGLLQSLGEVKKTEMLLGKILGELTAESVVAFPVILENLVDSLDTLAQELGYDSWEKVERMADDQLSLENDSLAGGRREEMVSEFTRRIIESVRNRATQSAKLALVNAMADTFALEQGGEYLGQSGDSIIDEIEKMIGVALADKLGIFSETEIWGYEERDYIVSQGVDWEGLWAQREWVMSVFRNNPIAAEARATGCGGAGISTGIEISMSHFEVSYQNSLDASYSGMEIWQHGYDEILTEANSSEERMQEGDKACYQCPVCEGEGKTPAGDVHLRSGYLVCSSNPEKHRLKYSSAD